MPSLVPRSGDFNPYLPLKSDHGSDRPQLIQMLLEPLGLDWLVGDVRRHSVLGTIYQQ